MKEIKSVNARFFKGSERYNNLEPCWFADVTNSDNYTVTISEGESRARGSAIDLGYRFSEGYGTLECRTFLLSLTLANATDKDKNKREYAKQCISEWHDTGLEIWRAAQEAIAAAKISTTTDN